MDEQPFAVRDLIEVTTGSYTGRQGFIYGVPEAPGVFYDVRLWPREVIGRRGRARYRPSAAAAAVQLTAGQMKKLPLEQKGEKP